MLVLLLTSGCEYRAGSGTEQALRQEQEEATRPDQVSEDVQFFIYENDRPRALVLAGRMERYAGEDSTYTLLQGSSAGPPGSTADSSGRRRVTVRIFGGSRDSVTATIRANRLVYHDEKRRFDARGRVIVTTAAGKRLESEHLAWHEDERRISTPGFVHITTPDDRIQGYGLRADENLETYHLRRVTGQVTVEEAP